MKDKILRGDIFLANLNPSYGYEQGGIRPVVVIQNDVGNCYSQTIIIACITSRIKKTKVRTHMRIDEKHGLLQESVIMTEQIRTIDKSRLKFKISHLGYEEQYILNQYLKRSLSISKGDKRDEKD